MAKRVKKQPKRPKRNVIVIIVEGESDRIVLENAISEMLYQIDDSIETFFTSCINDNGKNGGDITTISGVRSWNIEPEIYDRALFDLFNKEKIMPKDVDYIIHIVDMDGAYIPDDNIQEYENLQEENGLYYDDRSGMIHTSSKESTVYRNEIKRTNLDHLNTSSVITFDRNKTIPYCVYFFSSNIDHFLYGNANLEPWKKVAKAKEFNDKYLGDIQGFVKYFKESPYALQNMDYQQSWDFIKEGINSIHRHTNLNILMEGLMNKIINSD